GIPVIHVTGVQTCALPIYRLDSMAYEVEKNSKEWAEKLPEELRKRLDESVERARKALRGDDVSELRAAQEELSKVYSEAGQALYAQGTATADDATQQQGAQATADAAQEDVVEADYEIVDENK